MISIAITGGIGSGKTFVSNLLKEHFHIPIYNSDDEAKRLMLTDEGIRRDLIGLLGEEAYQGEALNKPLLASYLFADADNAARINAIVHPRVKADFHRWLSEHQDAEIAGLECAILYEAGFEDTVNVWMFPPKSRSADFIPCALRIFIASSPANPFPAAPKSNIIPGAAVM